MASDRPGDLASRQLDALDWVHRALEAAEIDYWLFGGWAVDLHAGTVTRSHADVDIAVWLDSVDDIARMLEAGGWHHAPSDDDGGTGYEREDVRLELTYLVRDSDGTIYTPLRDGRAGWPIEMFGDDVAELCGVRARVASLGALTEGKSWTRDDPEDAAKDRADHTVLSRLPR